VLKVDLDPAVILNEVHNGGGAVGRPNAAGQPPLEAS
jgi:hypothetical protein